MVSLLEFVLSMVAKFESSVKGAKRERILDVWYLINEAIKMGIGVIGKIKYVRLDSTLKHADVISLLTAPLFLACGCLRRPKLLHLE